MIEFDPEKIDRIEAGDFFFMQDSYSDMVVRASDYDALLEIHLRHVGMIAGLFERCGEPLSEEKIAALKNGTWR